jgi:PAS domain S-box-containing protein
MLARNDEVSGIVKGADALTETPAPHSVTDLTRHFGPFLLLGALLAVGYWVFDAGVRDGSTWSIENIEFAADQEVLGRTMAAFALIVFGAIAQYQTNRRRETGAALERRSMEQDVLLQYGPVAFALIRDRIIIRGNRHLENMFGWSPEDYVGRSAAIMYPSPEAFETVTEKALLTLTTGQRGWITSDFRRKDGTLFPARFRGAWVDEDNHDAGRIWMTEDISAEIEADREREELLAELEQATVNLEARVRERTEELGSALETLRQREAMFRAITENTSDHMAVIGEDEKFKYVTPATERLTGFATANVVGRSYLKFVVPEDHPIATNAFREAKQNPGVTVRLPHIRSPNRDGQVVDYEVLMTNLLHVEGVDGITINLRDISERRRVENDLLLAKVQAESASAAKSKFLSSMSHELRTPMNAVLGFAQLLQLESSQILADDQRVYVKEIIAAGGQMMELINNVLGLVEADDNGDKRDTEDAAPKLLINKCINLVEGAAERRSITLSATLPETDLPLIRVVPSHFRQALLSVLSNAIKYNRPNGKVTVSCKVLEDKCVRVLITDTGEGLPEGMRDELFEPFERLGAHMTSIAGMGVGLTVARGLVEAMGGRIDYESTIGEGSTFWIDVPMSDDRPKETVTSLN